MTEEKKLQAMLLAFLKTNGIYCFKTMANNKSGVPDVIACIEGVFFAFEVKGSKGMISRLQQKHLQDIQQNKGMAFLIRPNNYLSVTGKIKQFQDKFKKKLDSKIITLNTKNKLKE